MSISFAPPRLERLGPLVLAGLLRSHRLGRDRMDLYRDIASQWRAFASIARDFPHLPPVRGFGAGLRMQDGATALIYFSGYAVSGREYVPEPLSVLELPPLYCAVFDHHEHLSHLRSTIELIYATVLPMAGIDPADEAPNVPEFISRYSDGFNPATGKGGVEVLVPVKA